METYPYLFNIHHGRKALLICLSIVFLLSACSTQPLESADKEERIPVKVAEIIKDGFTQTIELSGRSRSQLDYPVISPSPMTVKEVLVQLGEQVKEGETLLIFDNEQAAAQLDQARQQVQGHEISIANLEKAQEQMLQPNSPLNPENTVAVERAQAVLNGAHTGAVTMLDLLQASTQLMLIQNQRQSIPNLDSSLAVSPAQLQAQLGQARAQLQLAEDGLERLIVKAF